MRNFRDVPLRNAFLMLNKSKSFVCEPMCVFHHATEQESSTLVHSKKLLKLRLRYDPRNFVKHEKFSRM